MNGSRVEQLMLLSAGTAAERSDSALRARRLASEVDWTRLSGALASMRLTATLGPRIATLAEGVLVQQFSEGVAAALADAQRKAALLALVGQRALSLLHESGIRASALKGPALAEALYGDPARRSSSDIDLLVAPEQLGAAVEVVRQLGYAIPDDTVDHSGLPLLHFTLVHERGELPPIELHWRIHWYERRFAQARLLAPVGAAADWLPEPADQLAALLLFYARDGFLGLRHACDIGAWWDAYGERLRPGELESVVDHYPALGPAIRAGMVAAERTVGLPLAQILRAQAHLNVRELIAVRLCDPCPDRSTAQQYAQMSLIDGLLSPTAQLPSFARRQFAPQRAMAARQEATAGRSHPKLELGHSLRVLGRCALALLGLVRPRAQTRSGGEGVARGLRRRRSPVLS